MFLARHQTIPRWHLPALGAVFILLVLFTIGCNAKPGGGGAAQFVSPLVTTGNWQGPYSTSLTASTTADFALNQQGSTATGSYLTLNGTIRGTLSGYVFSDILNFTLTETAPCAGTFTGTAEADGTNGLVLNFSGSDCAGAQTAGLARLRKI